MVHALNIIVTLLKKKVKNEGGVGEGAREELRAKIQNGK